MFRAPLQDRRSACVLRYVDVMSSQFLPESAETGGADGGNAARNGRKATVNGLAVDISIFYRMLPR